ncbi:MAG: response regulator [bacterium]
MSNRSVTVAPAGVVCVVDDDPSVRKGLLRLLRTAGFKVELFASAEEFLERQDPMAGGCIVLDIQMPGLGGFDLQDCLRKLNCCMPVIFITGHGDIPMSVRAMKKGAVDFLSKPFDKNELLRAVVIALNRDKEARELRTKTAKVAGLIGSLTPREREVMKLVVAGMLNKQVAAELDIKEQTVKVHRGRVMGKLGATSVAELTRLSLVAESAESFKTL